MSILAIGLYLTWWKKKGRILRERRKGRAEKNQKTEPRPVVVTLWNWTLDKWEKPKCRETYPETPRSIEGN